MIGREVIKYLQGKSRISAFLLLRIFCLQTRHHVQTARTEEASPGQPLSSASVKVSDRELGQGGQTEAGPGPTQGFTKDFFTLNHKILTNKGIQS